MENEHLDDPNSKTQYLVDQEQSNDKVVAISVPDGEYWAINTVAGRTVREDILVHINRTYDELFLSREDDLEKILEMANQMAE